MVLKRPVDPVLFLTALAGICCARAPVVQVPVVQVPVVQVPDVTLDAPGGSVRLRETIARVPLTVLVFFGANCHCLTQHDPRLRALYLRYHARGVQFFMIDSEADGTLARDIAESIRRQYPFPILRDQEGHLADALGAEYATYSVVLDASGRARYSGGIDSDRTHLRDDSDDYLAHALDDLLAGHEPRVGLGKVLGCALERR